MAVNAQRTPQTLSERVRDYTLRNNAGEEVKLSSLFSSRDHLIVLHNMGESCPTCLIYASEFDGALKHVEARAAFCAAGPDDPATQKAYAERNGWKLRLHSAQGSTFIADMGFEDEAGGALPGVSILQKENGAMTLISQVNIAKDGWCPSVLEVLWMLPENTQEGDK